MLLKNLSLPQTPLVGGGWPLAFKEGIWGAFFPGSFSKVQVSWGVVSFLTWKDMKKETVV